MQVFVLFLIRILSFLRLNKAIATIGFTVKRETWNNSSAQLYQYNSQYIETLFKYVEEV